MRVSSLDKPLKKLRGNALTTPQKKPDLWIIVSTLVMNDWVSLNSMNPKIKRTPKSCCFVWTALIDVAIIPHNIAIAGR
jgi:hypothetical protein